MRMTRVATQISPADAGRRMSLDEFEHAEGVPGSLYELSRGVISVMDVPSIPHALQIDALREQVSEYRRKHPGKIFAVLGSMDCKVLLRSLDSERHPDLSIYRHPPEEPDNWATWIADIVVEVVSPSSRQRDYEEKPDEYLLFGIREYWIVDRFEGQMVVHRRVGGRWDIQRVKLPEQYETKLLPGLRIDIQAVFDAAGHGD
jgi:Uma2 family endonuclease